MNIEQHNFITQYLRHNSAYTAYCIAYNVEDQSQYETIMAAAYQLMDNPEVGGVIRSVLDGVRHDVEQEIRAQQKTELLTVQRKRELLANIATGEMYAIQNYKGKDCSQCTQMVRPTINQMLKAIDLDSKLAGHYSVDKRQSTVDSLQLAKSENTPEIQQNATTHLSCAGGGVCRTGVDYSQKIENTSETQQNAKTYLSPTGGVVHRTGMGYSQRIENIPESQHNITNEQNPLTGRESGEVLTYPKNHS